MVNYKASIEEGIKAAKIAEANKAEIQSVFDEMNRQIAEHTGKPIVIRPRECHAPSSMFNRIDRQVKSFYGLSSDDDNSYWAIVAFTENSAMYELAKWELDKNGYPCSISYRNVLNRCENKEALEQALARLLQDPDVGEAIYQLTITPDAGSDSED